MVVVVVVVGRGGQNQFVMSFYLPIEIGRKNNVRGGEIIMFFFVFFEKKAASPI